jgi:hypothetical protein
MEPSGPDQACNGISLPLPLPLPLIEKEKIDFKKQSSLYVSNNP